MKNLLQIGGDVAPETLEGMLKVIEMVFRVGAETRMDPKTIRAAIKASFRVVVPSHTSITNSTFYGHPDDEPASNVDEPASNVEVKG